MRRNILAQIDRLNQQVARLIEQRRYEEAIKRATTMVDFVRQKIGEQSMLFAESLNNLAMLYYKMGEYAKAEPLFIQALTISRTELGVWDHDVANSVNNLAMLYVEMGEYTKAEPLHIQALTIRQAVLGEQHPDVAESLNNLGFLYINMGEYDRGEPLLQQALAIWRSAFGEQHPFVATGLNNLATLYEKTIEYSKAEPLFIQALAIRRAVFSERHPAVAESLNKLAGLYIDKGEYAKSEPLLIQALAIRRAVFSERHPTVAESLNNLAVLYRWMGEYAKAMPLLIQALSIWREVFGERDPNVATSKANLAALYVDMGEYARAEPLLIQALAIRRAALGERHPAVAEILNGLAELYRSMGKYAGAQTLYQQALDIRRTVFPERHPAVAESLNDLGLLYRDIGEYTKAEPLLIQALEIRRAVLGERHPDTATSVYILGTLYTDTGNYAKAEPLLIQALEIRQAVISERHPDVAQSLNGLAGLYYSMQEYSKAEPLLIQALEIRRAAFPQQHPGVAESLNNLATLYVEMGEYTQAEPLLIQALAIMQAAFPQQHPDVAQFLNDLAALYMDIGEYTQAEPLLIKALAIMQAAFPQQHPDVALFLSNLAYVYVALGREREAFDLLLQTFAIQDQMIDQIFSYGSERRRMAYLATLQGSFMMLLSLVFQFFPAAPQQVQAAMDIVLRRKGIGAEALAAQRDALLGGRYPALTPQLEQLTTLRIQIVQKTLEGPGPESSETYQKRLREWSAQKEQLEADLARLIPEMNLTQRLRQGNSQIIANTLPHDALLIEFVRLVLFDFHAVPARGEQRWKPAHYIAFVLSGDEPERVELIDLGEAERVDGLIAIFRMPLSRQQARDLLPDDEIPDEVHLDLAGKELRRMIFDPLLPHLLGRRHLFLVPDGDLSRLPFEVLPTEDDKRLIDLYEISYLSVGRDLLRFTAQNARPPQPAVVIADPDFDLAVSSTITSVEEPASAGRRSAELTSRSLAFERLLGTRQEGQQTAQAIGVQALLDGEAMVGPLKALRSPRILHLATHGFFLPDQPHDPNKGLSPAINRSIAAIGSGGMMTHDRLSWLMGQHLENPLLRSGLAFAGANTWNRGGALPPEVENGLLTAEDVSGMDLLDTELVVLSACETGLGQVQIGEGVFGLRRTFMLAGAKTLIMSLWKVPDRQTQELMADFYRRLLAGQPRARALREAQLALKEKYPHPYFWGAFICQGDPGGVSW